MNAGDNEAVALQTNDSGGDGSSEKQCWRLSSAGNGGESFALSEKAAALDAGSEPRKPRCCHREINGRKAMGKSEGVTSQGHCFVELKKKKMSRRDATRMAY